jgi:hypothetical protein
VVPDAAIRVAREDSSFLPIAGLLALHVWMQLAPELSQPRVTGEAAEKRRSTSILAGSASCSHALSVKAFWQALAALFVQVAV